VLLQVMLPRFWVASIELVAPPARRQGRLPWQEQGATPATC